MFRPEKKVYTLLAETSSLSPLPRAGRPIQYLPHPCPSGHRAHKRDSRSLEDLKYDWTIIYKTMCPSPEPPSSPFFRLCQSLILVALLRINYAPLSSHAGCSTNRPSSPHRRRSPVKVLTLVNSNLQMAPRSPLTLLTSTNSRVVTVL